MAKDFSIDAEWLSADHGSAEIRETSAFIAVSCGDLIATRIEDDWSKSVHPKVRLSAYPLALWFAASWWRLRWEPSPRTLPSSSWKQAHEPAGAGGGFIWPRLVFGSDGEMVDIDCRPTQAVSTEPIRYLSTFHTSVPVRIFESAVDDFLSLVIARLASVGLGDTQLATLWAEVLEERSDPSMTEYRRLEAALGFEPDEAPEALLEDLLALSSQAGREAVMQIAPAALGRNVEEFLRHMKTTAAAPGLEGKIEVPATLVSLRQKPEFLNQPPWERGRVLARAVRGAWNLPTSPIPSRQLGDLLCLPANFAEREPSNDQAAPMGLAVRTNGSGHLALHFRKRHSQGRRFEAARFLADHLSAPADDRWLPAADTKTSRQRLQRAFAVELLCPIEALTELLAGDFSTEAIEDAAEYFDVSSLAVKSHLANNAVISREAIESIE